MTRPAVTVTAAGAQGKPGPTVTVTNQAPQSSAAAPDAAGIPGDGTYLVPGDIKPGTYRSAKPGSGNCYWARLKSAGGGLGDIIANGNTAGQVTVTILASDKAFQTTGCEDWVKVR